MPGFRTAAVVLSFFLAAATLVAQPLTIGKMPDRGLFTYSADPNALTFIDLSHPAPRAGTIAGFNIRWSAPAVPCANAFSVKILRPNANVTAWTIVANLGTYSSATETATLPAPVNVQTGDLLSVTQFPPITTCGSLLLSTGNENEVIYRAYGDITSGVAPTAALLLHGSVFNAIAWQTASPLAATLPVIGSAPGNFGSFFRTSVQFNNSDFSHAANLHMVFHPQGQSASPSDPSRDLTVPAGSTATYLDFPAGMALTGIGSLDLYAVGGKMPIVTARVYNDNGAAGTQGFTEGAVLRENVMRSPHYGVLPYPADLVNSRMNVGVRTFDQGATIQFTPLAANGNARAGITKTYPANYFEQFNAASINSLGDGWISVYVTDGTAVVYASYTDNRTNDSSMKYATEP
jgi:hypothetical protein